MENANRWVFAGKRINKRGIQLMTYTNVITPKPLQKGDTIGLVAPSSPLQPGRLEVGVSYLEKHGFNVKIGKHLEDSDRFLAGNDKDRADDIMTFFKDTEVNAIMATAGGSGSLRLLNLLDYDVIRHHPKILTGFSDTTGLQLAILKKSALISYTGFTFRDADKAQIDSLVDSSLLSSLLGKSYKISEGETVVPGKVEAPLVGGTLSLITRLIGTPYQPDFNKKILFFEEVFAEPFQVDEMLSHLALAGIFKQVSGIIIGYFEHCAAQHNPERDGTVDDVINQWASKFNVPCIKNFPYGHGDRRCVLPIGKSVILDADEGMLSIPS